MNSGKRLLALSECADALSIVKEQVVRASGLLAELSKAESEETDDEDSVAAARLVAAAQKYFEPLRVKIQRRHDELARRFTEEWHL